LIDLDETRNLHIGMATLYEFICYTGVPGRGEHVRLILEEAGVSYKETQSLSVDEPRRPSRLGSLAAGMRTRLTSPRLGSSTGIFLSLWLPISFYTLVLRLDLPDSEMTTSTEWMVLLSPR
jgi:hypothetical protein